MRKELQIKLIGDKLLNFLLITYWWWMLLSGATKMFQYDFYVEQLYFASGLLLCGWAMFSLPKKHNMDIFVICYLCYMLLHALLDEYPNHATGIYRSIQNEFTFVLFYFAGRKLCLQDYGLFRGMKWPLIISMIAGLYFFFYQPDYYMANKGTRLNEYSTVTQIQEAFRLSSFWSSPYNLSYAIGCFSPFLWYSFFNNLKNRLILGLVILTGVTLLFAQMRVNIFCYIISGILMYVFYMKSQKKFSAKRHILVPAFACLILYFSYTFIMINVSVDHSNYLVEHMMGLMTNDGISSRLEGTGRNLTEVSLLGDGWGLYSQVVQGISGNTKAIIDFGYAGLLGEMGIVGLGFYIIIMFCSFLKAINHGKIFQVEICIVLMFFLAMWGAAANNHAPKSPHIYWFCIGSIWSGKERFKGQIDLNTVINNSKL